MTRCLVLVYRWIRILDVGKLRHDERLERVEFKKNHSARHLLLSRARCSPESGYSTELIPCPLTIA